MLDAPEQSDILFRSIQSNNVHALHLYFRFAIGTGGHGTGGGAEDVAPNVLGLEVMGLKIWEVLELVDGYPILGQIPFNTLIVVDQANGNYMFS